METLDLITDALRSIGVLGVTRAPSAEQGASALRNLNKLMASLAEDGIDLGYSPTTNINDDLLLPLGIVSTVEALLGMKEASDRGIEPPFAVASMASNGYERLLRQALLLSQKALPLATSSHGMGSCPNGNGWTGP